MADRRQCWLLEANGDAGGHVTVTVRCGEERYGRALVGHLTMRPYEWTVFHEAFRRGALAVSPAWADVDVEVVDRRRQAAMDF